MTLCSDITLVSGGCRSGKSKYAEDLLSKEKEVTYIATFNCDQEDNTWTNRILEHQFRRPKHWLLIENFNDINKEILSIKNGSSLLIDSVGGIIYNKLHLSPKEWVTFQSEFISVLLTYKANVVIVNEEVGFGITPTDKISNLFIDRLGNLSQKLEDISDYSYLLFHGKVIDLKKIYL